MSDDEYNDGYTHEALHTASVLMDTWDQHVIDTRCADEFPDVKKAAGKAAEAMWEVYHLIGQKFRDDPPVIQNDRNSEAS
jgi:hypothetical protein